MPCPSVLMSSGRLFLAGWSPPEPAALRRQAQNNLLACWTASVYHRMAPSVLTGCLTRGGHPRAVTIVYTNQFGTTFDGTTITSTDNDGQGIITFAGPSFNAFSFSHNQGAQAGFVIERIQIDTGAAVIPEPATVTLLGAGLAGVALLRKRLTAK